MELADRVEQISAMIRELRENAGDGPRARQLVDAIFRSVHSLKAAAAADGLDEVSRRAHDFENLLHSLRTGKVKLDEDALRVMDESAAALSDGSYSSLGGVKQLRIEEKVGGELPPEFAGLKDEERHRAAEAVREGSKLFIMEAVFEVNDFDRRFRELRDQLGKNSEIISTSAQMEDTNINFRILYASSSEKIPVSIIFQQALGAGKSSGKEIEFVVQGREVIFEKPIADALGDAVLHLVRNAVDHGIESSGKIILDAAETHITVTDDGRGIDPADLPHIFQPGFSTAKDVTETSGRGVGLDVVATTIKELGGTVTVTSEPGKGSSFKINLPDQWSEIKKRGPSSDA